MKGDLKGLSYVKMCPGSRKNGFIDRIMNEVVILVTFWPNMTIYIVFFLSEIIMIKILIRIIHTVCFDTRS